MKKIDVFFEIAKKLNEQENVMPLLFGSLGLEQRLKQDLSADDVDVLITQYYMNDGWNKLVNIMEQLGYKLYDLHEHAFEKDGVSVAFASLESLIEFAQVDISKIPIMKNQEVKYLLLKLEDYLKVYKASSKDSYRANKNNDKDMVKIELIESMLNKEMV